MFLGGRSTTGSSQLVALYEAQDAEGIADAVVLESLPGVTRDQVVQVLGSAFQNGVAIASQEQLEGQGQRFTEVVTNNGLRLCERPDGRILINCRLGQVLYDAAGSPSGTTVDFAGAELFPGDARLQIAVVAAGDDGVTLTRPFEVSAGGQPFEATVEASPVGQFGVGPPVEGDVEVPPGGAVLVVFHLSGDDLWSLLQQDLTVRLGDAEITLSPSETTSFLS